MTNARNMTNEGDDWMMNVNAGDHEMHVAGLSAIEMNNDDRMIEETAKNFPEVKKHSWYFFYWPKYWFVDN